MPNRIHSVYGYLGGEVPVVGVIALSDSERTLARQALKSVVEHNSEGVIETPDSPWLVARPQVGLTRQSTLDELDTHGNVTFLDTIPVAEAKKYIGPAVVRQLVGNRPDFV